MRVFRRRPVDYVKFLKEVKDFGIPSAAFGTGRSIDEYEEEKKIVEYECNLPTEWVKHYR